MFFGFVRKRRRVRKVRRAPARERAHYHTHRAAARALVHARLTYWNAMLGLAYGRVAIRNQRSRWGSCSSQKNLNFNYRMIFLPHELIDYIVVHELCHLIEFNHSPAFWSHVERVLPDYRAHRAHLKTISPARVSGATVYHSV